MFQNALVIIANNAVFTTIVGVLSAAPLALLSVNKTLGVIISIAMALIGCTFMALCWIALADRGMVKCHNKKWLKTRPKSTNNAKPQSKIRTQTVLKRLKTQVKRRKINPQNPIKIQRRKRKIMAQIIGFNLSKEDYFNLADDAFQKATARKASSISTRH